MLITLMLLDAPESALYGQLAILATLLILVATIFAFTEKRVRAVVVTCLQDPKSPLGIHLSDPDAHEKMREKMFDKLDITLRDINRNIEKNREESHSDFMAFQRDVIAPIMEQNKATLELLARTMDRERKFRNET